jgi:molybdopterin molybdotransferase
MDNIMLNVDEAFKEIISNVSVINESEKTDIFNCCGRILFNDLIAGINIPSQNNSAMDGYAVISDDIVNATPDNPACLKIIDEIQAGHELNNEKLTNGHAIRIMTGAPIPDGADCVVQFEDTEEIGDVVNIYKKPAKHENIRFAGEDIKKGEVILRRGTRIDSAESGLISSLNIKEFLVYKRPKAGIISTGDELTEPGEEYTGKTINSNAYMLYSEIKKYGGDPCYKGIVSDNYENVKKIFLELMDNDIIISSGGVSMGRYDFIPDVLKDIGIDIKVHKVLMKPGKPVIFGTYGSKLFFGLPGNPVSVMVSFMQFVRPALLKMAGNGKILKPVIKAQIKEDIVKKKGRKNFIRGIFTVENGMPVVQTTGPQGSGILTSMSAANCLIILSEEVEVIKNGEYVDIQLTGHIEI